jgi:hypothetical protein
MLESYGAIAYDDAQMSQALEPSRRAWRKAIESRGAFVLSGRVRSPTFAGGSELAHLGLLSGIDLSDPFTHDLLLTSSRPTLVSLFRERDYRTFGVYPALSWDWPERRFYGYDTFLDGRDLKWQGPHFGAWRIPDQYAMARFLDRHRRRAGEAPQFVFLATINGHLPFLPTPPYQPDWSRMLSSDPYDAAQVRAALAERPDWLALRPGYVRALDYMYRWLAGHESLPRAHPHVLIAIGDHQPASGVSGPAATWDVPVHVVTTDPELRTRLSRAGLTDGLEPARTPLGAMHEFTALLLQVFDSRCKPDATAYNLNGNRGLDPMQCVVRRDNP